MWGRGVGGITEPRVKLPELILHACNLAVPLAWNLCPRVRGGLAVVTWGRAYGHDGSQLPSFALNDMLIRAPVSGKGWRRRRRRRQKERN